MKPELHCQQRVTAKFEKIVIDSDLIHDLLVQPTSGGAIVLLTEVSHARSISRLLRSGVRAILSRESDPDDVLSAIYAVYDGLVLLSTAAISPRSNSRTFLSRKCVPRFEN